jgi:hypothetical protein
MWSSKYQGMSDDKTKKAIDLKKRLSAFADFLEHGISHVKQFYPDQLAFVQQYKDQPYQEVKALIEKELYAL